jgi:hypothetical protein
MIRECIAGLLRNTSEVNPTKQLLTGQAGILALSET